MIILQTNAPDSVISKLNTVLVDENKKEINDTVYGTGKEIYDPCTFLSYEDFTAYRTKRIQAHQRYRYDTVYYFAKGFFIVKYNYCKYRERKLYLGFVDLHSADNSFHYIEILDSLRIHLHDYSTELYAGDKENILQKIQPYILKLNCSSLLLRKEECQ
jgi:hypothetical protein